VRVGDLVKFKNNDMVGLVVGIALNLLGDTMYAISWVDGHDGYREAHELEVINASR
jgi:hypothetical protein